MKALVWCVAAACVVCGACQKPVARLNAPPHGTSEEANPLQSHYAHMIDNALLEDMTVSDVHFLPHRPLLNTLGRERLSRLAALMEAYGGTIRFSTDLTDEKLIQARTDQITAFLSEAGLDTTQEVLSRDLPGGRGMDAGQAVLIKANEGTYKPKKTGGGTAPPQGAVPTQTQTP